MSLVSPLSSLSSLSLMALWSALFFSSIQELQAACPYSIRQRRDLQYNGGMGGGGMMGGWENGMNDNWEQDMYDWEGGMGGGHQGVGAVIMQLFNNRLLMQRNVVHNDDGTIRTKTTSDDATTASLLQNHVATMQQLTEENLQVRPWDPFFVELFDRHDELDVQVTNLEDGVEVLLSAFTECGQALIEDHTSVVSNFVATGMVEASKAHPVPEACQLETPPVAFPVQDKVETSAPVTSPLSTISPSEALPEEQPVETSMPLVPTSSSISPTTEESLTMSPVTIASEAPSTVPTEENPTTISASKRENEATLGGSSSAALHLTETGWFWRNLVPAVVVLAPVILTV